MRACFHLARMFRRDYAESRFWRELFDLSPAGTAVLLDAGSGRVLNKMIRSRGKDDYLGGLCWSPDEKRIALETTHLYIEADLKMKQQALDKLPPLGTGPRRFRPNDKLLAFLEALGNPILANPTRSNAVRFASLR
jgi:hypothetical protein